MKKRKLERQSTCVVGKTINNQHTCTVWPPGAATTQQKHLAQNKRMHSIKQKQLSFCQRTTQQKENKTTGGARSATVISRPLTKKQKLTSHSFSH